eukprot:TRINITY_DN8557_c0_g2_i1.p1 TRINITY_DN8557_c0_g2~~TRINITY_DN8557_c0_g2_i1.p1  ORF type:complete len:178 (+),score=14.21 TRINITY_DN8557_c0_g2_i1:49-582(+)
MSSRLRDIAEQTKYSGGRRVNRRVDTRLFRGIVRQVDSHNKVVEEREAWEEHERRKRLEEDRLKAKIKRRQAERDRPRKSTDSELSRTNPAKRSKRDASPPRSSLAGPWTKKLLAMEASDPDRWGHEGFRQLHPEVFKDNKPSGLSNASAVTKHLECEYVYSTWPHCSDRAAVRHEG